MKIKKINDEVIAIDAPFALIQRDQIRELVEFAKRNPRGKMRICAHGSDADVHQEMFIVHTNDVYVRPHKHLKKAESLLVIEGTVEVFLFNDDGSVKEIISMSDYLSGKPFYYRLAKSVFHSLLIQSEYLIFKEGTTGPFVRSENVFAPWSPDESDVHAVAKFKESLRKKIS